MKAIVSVFHPKPSHTKGRPFPACAVDYKRETAPEGEGVNVAEKMVEQRLF